MDISGVEFLYNFLHTSECTHTFARYFKNKNVSSLICLRFCWLHWQLRVCTYICIWMCKCICVLVRAFIVCFPQSNSRIVPKTRTNVIDETIAAANVLHHLTTSPQIPSPSLSTGGYLCLKTPEKLKNGRNVNTLWNKSQN